MKLLRYILIFQCILIPLGNIIAQQVISSSGNIGENANGTLSYTLGELIIETKSNTNNIITQGFHQPTLTVTTVDEQKGSDYTVKVSPNPTQDYVIMEINKMALGKVSYILYDTYGKIIESGRISDGKAEISFISLQAGTYFIKVLNDFERKEVTTVKIVKQ